MRTLLLLLVASAAAAPFAASGRADPGRLVGSVGPGFTITLADAQGHRVQHLDPGSYTILVHDRSPEHNFHLAGSGVDESTSIEGVGDTTLTVTLAAGTYSFQCDAHAATMRGSFTVGGSTQPATPAKKPPAHKKAKKTPKHKQAKKKPKKKPKKKG
ncbi:MAG TPA: hypothetical protein VFJ77_05065 [Gaiellaceae bacterium]|nr:hypothetical protein [Gaiellaceae bacterium]